MKGEIKMFLERNENETQRTRNKTAKAVLRGMFTAIITFIKKKDLK